MFYVMIIDNNDYNDNINCIGGVNYNYIMFFFFFFLCYDRSVSTLSITITITIFSYFHRQIDTPIHLSNFDDEDDMIDDDVHYCYLRVGG